MTSQKGNISDPVSQCKQAVDMLKSVSSFENAFVHPVAFKELGRQLSQQQRIGLEQGG